MSTGEGTQSLLDPDEDDPGDPITDPTPNTMPSMVRNERVLCRHTSVTPSLMKGQ